MGNSLFCLDEFSSLLSTVNFLFWKFLNDGQSCSFFLVLWVRSIINFILLLPCNVMLRHSRYRWFNREIFCFSLNHLDAVILSMTRLFLWEILDNSQSCWLLGVNRKVFSCIHIRFSSLN